ncbi:MAG: restriction endonuclease subunit R [Microcoleus sp. PH2017_10_PVI_O_A]|uniref:restriction endonuclease subunit R n=1 Tax=unclassified Microcoleus TaxID=2642155 RepID=UPI001D9FA2B9|nr:MULTISPECIES: restriction endonuclease subunit R [unclassified Microcoleus]TAE83498.1 MAG: restriction endonuclease subunit R [Oscillatoriales cyanobacterium]MCC3404541.1 restriction endonuclease subunit R [Microcoleus sp. PH2017_10_PVI_O_A]MCC3458609.1 restriction endonuclease subunit R [Microcoleus sp. PH2017_11_PCY_U_A]MCC3476859.1 restriction endonuclease subunit R [Microcoleus sp. PH2017_12_PCY_D_A]MCC3559187.1 restriction endonuclease subunit R [Microcoleus sp. PH2017_27_LUM_O_A]
MTVINAKNLTLNEVSDFLKFQQLFNNDTYPSFLSLEPLTEFEQLELVQIRNDFREYLSFERVSEGLVQALTTFPLMRLAGFYRSPLKMSLEENIANITIEDEDTTITGRLDILAINKEKQIATDIQFWILVIESKNSLIAPRAGLPQLLTYAYKSLEYQESVWGLATSGEFYQFVNIRRGNPPTYQLMPFLSLMEPESSVVLLQVLKAICKL